MIYPALANGHASARNHLVEHASASAAPAQTDNASMLTHRCLSGNGSLADPALQPHPADLETCCEGRERPSFTSCRDSHSELGDQVAEPPLAADQLQERKM